MDNPERDLEERERLGWNLFYFPLLLFFIFLMLFITSTLLVLPSFSFSLSLPFLFRPSPNLSLSSPFFLLSSLPNHYPSSYLTALCNLDWLVWLLLTT